MGNEIDYNLANLERIVLEKAKAEGDVEFINLLRDIEDRSLVQDAASSHYDVGYTSSTRGPIKDRDKLTFTRKQMHGGSNDLNALNAKAMGFDVELNGPIVQRGWKQGESPNDIRLREAINRVVSSRGASELAKVGLRDVAGASMSPTERLLRAGDRITELDHGYNPVTGAPYAGQGLDGGHRVAHNTDHRLSSLRENMMFENKYENRTKGDRADLAAALSYRNSLRKKILSTATRDPEIPAGLFAQVWPVGKGY